MQWALVLAAIPHGYGRHDFYVPPEERNKAGLVLYSSQVPWSWGVGLSKISIAFMLLRIKHSLRWKTFLYAMIIIQAASAISANIVQFSACRPLAAMWDPLISKGNCWPHQAFWICILVNGIIAIVTDVIFTCIPVSFIYKIKRPFCEKLVVSFLLGLGMLASAASVMKMMTTMRKYGKTRDNLYDGVDMALWSMVEGEITIIAACVPCLKSPSEKVLRRLGWLRTDSSCSNVKHHLRNRIDLSSIQDSGTHDALDSLAGLDYGVSERGMSIERYRSSTIKD